MMYARTLAICAFGFVCSAHALEAQGLSQYRNFELGTDLASVSTLAGVASSGAKLLHQRPAVLQDLEWRPTRSMAGSTADSTDAIRLVLFSFYNDQLFRVVVDYGRERTEGMTNADMIEAVSALYGTPLGRTSRPIGQAAPRLEAESGSALARWGDAEHAVGLYQTSSYGSAFRLIVTETRLDDLARKAETQALRLDEQEAPRREVARQQKERADAAKARASNKDVFRP